MSRNWIAASLLALVPALALAQAKPAAPPASKPPAAADDTKKPYVVGSVIDAAAISFVDLEGKTHTLKEWAGKTVILDFWSIECPVSKGYEARLTAVANDYAGKGVVFLAVDANSGEIADASVAKIKDYVKKEKVPYTILLDKGNKVADRFDAQTTPHVFVIDDKGKLRYAGGVDDDENFKKTDPKTVKSFVREALDAVLAGKDPATTTTKPHGCNIKRAGAKS
jgi:thiol-disulfide isomerase/thioredoxin